jgi:acyl-CoA thioesterase FadM
VQQLGGGQACSPTFVERRAEAAAVDRETRRSVEIPPRLRSALERLVVADG